MADIDIPSDTVRMSFKDEIDLTKPVPLMISVAKEGDEPNVWYAPAAGRLAPTAETAQYLEQRESVRAEQSSPEAYAKRRALQDAKDLVAAETIPADAWKGWVCDGEETYAPSVDELVERLVDMDCPAPAYCWATIEKGFDFDLEDAVESYLADEHHEDAEEPTLPALLAFYDEWKKGARVTTYWPAKHIVIIDPTRFAAEVEAAQALIADAASTSSTSACG